MKRISIPLSFRCRMIQWAMFLACAGGVGVHFLCATGAWAQRGQGQVVAEMDGRVAQRQVVVEGDNNDGMAEGEVLLPPEVVNQWVFGGNLQPDDGRRRLEQQLQVRLEEISEHCQLSAEQVSKLRRAGRGDIVRFLRKVGEVQRLVSGKRRNVDMAMLINDHVQPLQLILQIGPFGADSLFHKTAARTLDPGQQSLLEELNEQRKRAAFRSRVELAIALLERSIPLLDKQRNELVELILARTAPVSLGRGDLDLLWIQYQISTLPDEQLREIFLEPQRAMLAALAQRVANQRQMLIERGLLDAAEH
jgi:hypothetical protein